MVPRTGATLREGAGDAMQCMSAEASNISGQPEGINSIDSPTIRRPASTHKEPAFLVPPLIIVRRIERYVKRTFSLFTGELARSGHLRATWRLMG